jgi:hypothetical protein
MNIKTMAAIVGTLSLGSLATGCASTKSAAPATNTATSEKGAEGSCGSKAGASTEKGAEGSCGSKAATTTEKGGQSGCGANGCGGTSNPK